MDAEIRALDGHYDSDTRASDAQPIHPGRVVSELRAAAPRGTVMLIESGAYRAFTGTTATPMGRGSTARH